ncbi:restriction endonuclease subunit S [Streptococcus gwangjuense]|uniref:Restriction endonuclease subunit S n=1 Tax=Streptococcus gwangjuensis TaxID=1433513 RepID=A0A387B1K7_9STRE|nr:restriction endonuclease subunit S [Streptococcus gwangjuense]
MFTVNGCHEDLPYPIEWEQRKLGDEVRIVMGQSPNSENYTDDPNGR